MNIFQIVAIPGEDDSLSSALGISESRVKQILKQISDVKAKYRAKSSISEELEEITAISKSSNETAFIGYILGSVSERESILDGAIKVSIEKVAQFLESKPEQDEGD